MKQIRKLSLNKKTTNRDRLCICKLVMVHPAGFEPATTWFEAKYSNPLSYGCSRALF